MTFKKNKYRKGRRHGRGYIWIRWEIGYLKRWYGKASVNKMIMTLGRSKSAIQSKAQKLRLTLKACQPWTLNDDVYLVERFGNTSMAIIKKKLRRTSYAIQNRAHDCRILTGRSGRGSPIWIPAEEVLLRAKAGLLSTDSIAKMINRINDERMRTKAAVEGKARYLRISLRLHPISNNSR